MDASLIGAYRLIWTDIVLINDAVKTCHAMNCLSVGNVAKALELIVRHESDLVYSITSGLQEDTEESGHVLDGNELSTESLAYVAWEFFHGVFLNFTVEELSQYPFWVAKTVSVVHPSPDHLMYALFGWMGRIWDMYTADGVLSLFRGIAPYLINRSVESYQHLEKSLRHFLDSAGRKLERTAASIDVSKIKEPEEYASRRSSSRAAQNSNSKKKVMKKGEAPPEKPSYLRRLAVAAMCHPLLLQAVRLVADRDLTHRNWVLLYFSMVSNGGIPSLYKGLTSSILFGVLPIPIAMYFGVVETVIYRRMAGQGSADRFGGGLSVLTSLLFEYTPHTEEQQALTTGHSGGVVGKVLALMFKPSHFINIFKYGFMTLGQVIPGFFSFALSRILMSNILGETPQRHREISIRRKILRDYLLDPPKSLKAKAVSINSQKHADIQSMHARKRGEYSGREYGAQPSSGGYSRQSSIDSARDRSIPQLKRQGGSKPIGL